MTLKVGVIGVGGIARTHMPGWAASEDAEVVAGSDISEAALQVWGEKNGITRLESDPAALFSDPDIDIIDVCTPNRYHAPLSIAALQAGKARHLREAAGAHAGRNPRHDRGPRCSRQAVDDRTALPLWRHGPGAQGRD